MSPTNHRSLKSAALDALGGFTGPDYTLGDINVLVAGINNKGVFSEAYKEFIEVIHKYMPEGWQWKNPDRRISELCENRNAAKSVRAAIRKYATQN